jgi:transposase
VSQESGERKAAAPRKPRRTPLPADLPRREFHHEPGSTQCASAGCGAPLQRMGEDITEKLD